MLEALYLCVKMFHIDLPYKNSKGNEAAVFASSPCFAFTGIPFRAGSIGYLQSKQEATFICKFTLKLKRPSL